MRTVFVALTGDSLIDVSGRWVIGLLMWNRESGAKPQTPSVGSLGLVGARGMRKSLPERSGHYATLHWWPC